jgi:glycosyltransferase involved in cell wall biosynthesis
MYNKLLSICIPTYNRDDKIKISLLAILKQVDKYQDKIEVIVSDNASTDNTQDFLNELKKEYPFLKIFRNEKNLGFNLNIFKLSDNYAIGKYFWLIGDDDVIDFDAVDLIISILENNKSISFLGLNFRILPLKDILELKKTGVNNVGSIKMCTLINNQCRPENLLATFMSCNIVLLDKFKNYDKSKFSNNSWDDYKSLFPHTHIITSIISPIDDVIYIEEPLMSVILNEKDWDDKLALINVFYIIDVYKNYIKSGFNQIDIREAKKVIINSGLGTLINPKVKFKYKLNFLKFVLIDLYFYKLIIKKLLNKI